MRRNYLYFVWFPLLLAAFSSLGTAQDKPADKARATVSAPTSGARAEFLAEVGYYEQRYIRLAEAMPAEEYSWRPAEGVRSVGEVYTHIVAANYGIARALGTAPPAGLDFKSITAMSNDKPKVIQALKDSFAHFRGAISSIRDADLDKPQKMFGQQTTVRGSFLVITGHTGEHLGQSIAYARTNGIVPPWTEEAQQQQQKPAQKPNR